MASWSAHATVERLEATGSDALVVRFDVRTAAGSLTAAFDVRTGDPAPLALPAGTPDEVDLPAGWQALSTAAAGDRALVVAALRAPNGGRSTRLLHVGPHGVSTLGCPRPHETPFAAGGALYTAWADGDAIRWGRWTALDPGRAPGRPRPRPPR